jgi:hypothetical protein
VIGKPSRVSIGHQKPGFTVVDQFAARSDISRDHGFSTGHRLQHDIRKPFPLGGEPKHIRIGQQFWYIISLTEKENILPRAIL